MPYSSLVTLKLVRTNQFCGFTLHTNSCEVSKHELNSHLGSHFCDSNHVWHKNCVRAAKSIDSRGAQENLCTGNQKHACNRETIGMQKTQEKTFKLHAIQAAYACT